MKKNFKKLLKMRITLSQSCFAILIFVTITSCEFNEIFNDDSYDSYYQCSSCKPLSGLANLWVSNIYPNRPQWMETGDGIIYTESGETTILYTLYFPETNPTEITREISIELFFQSGSGKIYILGGKDDKGIDQSLYSINHDGSERELIVGSIVNFSEMVISEKDEKLAYSTVIDGIGTIYVIDLIGEQNQTIPFSRGMTFSPDGQKFAFATHKIDNYRISDSIFVINLINNQKRFVAFGRPLSFSPDGQKLLIIKSINDSIPDGPSQLKLINLGDDSIEHSEEFDYEIVSFKWNDEVLFILGIDKLGYSSCTYYFKKIFSNEESLVWYTTDLFPAISPSLTKIVSTEYNGGICGYGDVYRSELLRDFEKGTTTILQDSVNSCKYHFSNYTFSRDGKKLMFTSEGSTYWYDLETL